MFPDEQAQDDPLKQFLTEQVDKALEGAFELFDLKTLSVKDASAEERYFKAFHEHIELTIGELCKTSVLSLKINYRGGNYNSLASESRRLHLIWEALRHKVESRIKFLVDNYLKGADVSPQRYLSLVESWAYVLTNCRNFVTRILPSLQYMTVNYPSVTKEATRKLQIFDYFMIYFMNLLKDKLAEDFETFLEAFLSEQRSRSSLDMKYLNCEMPLSLMFRYKISVGHTSALHVRSFYLRSVELYAAETLHIPVNMHYRENLTKILVRNAIITGSISASLVTQSNDIILQHTIMNKNTTRKLLELLKDNTEIVTSSGADSPASQLFGVILMSYGSRSMMDELWSIFKTVISITLKSVESSPTSEKQLLDACKLLVIANQSKYLEKLAHDEVIKNLKGTIGIMERYLKVCESAIRKFNQVTVDGTSEPSNSGSLALNLPLIMKLPSSFLKIYSRSLFRRCIVHGLPAIETLTCPSSFEYHLFSLFEREYGASPEYDGLHTLKSELLRSAQIARNFNQTQAVPLLNPLVFERKSVPSVIHENLVDDLILPPEMRHWWTRFQRFYYLIDAKAPHKKLQLIDSLQHCEVQTQIQLANGAELILDLTLYQTCILTLFNDNDALSLEEMSTRSNISIDLLSEVVESFTRIGLFTSQNSLIILNENFSPDERKIKNGKLRVTMTTRGKSSKEGSAEIVQHMEGLSSHWKQEMIKACIVRSLKGEKSGLKFDSIYAKVESQMFGISIGEFKDALERTVLENSITHWRGLYKY
ncbi:hypothetical protein HG536_0F02250 [Torulaspora globosa]|uniref:Cullin family profile domain-containing protein n=1 Tax=Torulaspora globosa TaxID=48254 RepID=A0A7G3ZK64_9SACH|nr:uncharacterized protein HG536_0F02250 [Torulaspora globosa]QLL33900.1 hypothetical protein HG536_0F02250 [Torulaspora globosa]